MFNRFSIALFLFLFSLQVVWCQGSLWSVQKDLAFLSSDLTAGRFSGSDGERLAARYIAERFAEAGVKPGGTNGYFQAFELKLPAHPHDTVGTGAPITATNVIGWLDNNAATTVVIGAHYDHLGEGGHGSRHTGEPAIHNGADDNASGVAALIYMAEALAKNGPKNNNYLFIGFSGEELGLFGSKYFVENPTIPLASINYMLNMDMVGRLDTVLVINGAGTSPSWKDVFNVSNKPGFSLVTNESGIGPSDHTSFYLKNIPAIHFFTGQHGDYHKPSDDAHLVNCEGIQTVGEFLLSIIRGLDPQGRIPFSKTKDEDTQRSRSFKVTMGVMPDYTYQGQGMRIDGVLEGRPAKAAGLENGDIILQIGDIKVGSIQDYMGALGQFNKGDTTKVTVKRKDQELQKEITF
ncbi:MAG: M20/M25/M40 family metallo-hydrolase [Saprospiraceae bacterium]|nr:M20/M25/M40 family metallo-hydrolase [Saprospiraceae bacterium]